MKCHYFECIMPAITGTKSCSLNHTCNHGLCDILNCNKQRYGTYYTCTMHNSLRLKLVLHGMLDYLSFVAIYNIAVTNILSTK